MVHTGPLSAVVKSIRSETRMLTIGHLTIRVTTENRGQGRPLLLINGIGATGDLFDPFRAHLTDRETITFDAPGVGGSSTPTYPPTMRRLAGVVAKIIDQLGHRRVDVLGLSWGGALAQELTHRHPDRVRRLVLAATMPGWTSVPGRPAAMSILMSPMRYYSPEYLRRVAPTLYGGVIAQHPDLLDEHARQRSSNPPSQVGYLYQLSALRRWTSLPWLRNLTHPTLVLAGDDDPIIPIANARLMAHQLPSGRLHTVKGGGHLFLFTRAEELAEVVRNHLSTDAALAKQRIASAV